jgi:hypothetical protein
MEKIYDVLNQSSLTYEEKFKIGVVILEEYFKEKEKMLTEKIITKDSNKIIWGKSSDREMTWEEANEWCKEQGGRLPKMWELVKAWEEKEEGFVADGYWSSAENSTTLAYGVYFGNGTTIYATKAGGYYVRCVLD